MFVREKIGTHWSVFLNLIFMIFYLDLIHMSNLTVLKYGRNRIINFTSQARVLYFFIFIFSNPFHGYNLILGNYAYRYSEFYTGVYFFQCLIKFRNKHLPGVFLNKDHSMQFNANLYQAIPFVFFFFSIFFPIVHINIWHAT